MEDWRDSWRILFGQTPVNIKGAFSYDETIDRLNVVLSQRFVSSHSRYTLAGGPNVDGRLEFSCGHNFYFIRHTIERTKGRSRASLRPSIALLFIGDLKIDKGGYIWLRGHLSASTSERWACILLLFVLVTGLLLLPWASGWGASVFITILLGMIIVPVVLLSFWVLAFEEMGEKLTQMLRLVMTEPLE